MNAPVFVQSAQVDLLYQRDPAHIHTLKPKEEIEWRSLRKLTWQIS